MDKKLREEIIDWNIRFPIDRWWRNKHNIAYMSSAHRESNFLDQLFEYEEEKLFEKLMNNDYKPNQGDWLKVPKRNELSIEEEFNLMKKS